MKCEVHHTSGGFLRPIILQQERRVQVNSCPGEMMGTASGKGDRTETAACDGDHRSQFEVTLDQRG